MSTITSRWLLSSSFQPKSAKQNEPSPNLLCCVAKIVQYSEPNASEEETAPAPISLPTTTPTSYPYQQKTEADEQLLSSISPIIDHHGVSSFTAADLGCHDHNHHDHVVVIRPLHSCLICLSILACSSFSSTMSSAATKERPRDTSSSFCSAALHHLQTLSAHHDGITIKWR